MSADISTDPRALVERATAVQREGGHADDAFMSLEAGFVPLSPPQLALPSSHAAWDQLAADLPLHARDCTLAQAVDDLPELSAAPQDLPAQSLCRASSVLGHLAHAWVRAHRDPHPALPPALDTPWRAVTPSASRIAGIRRWMDAMNPLGGPVTTVAVRSASPVPRSVRRSHSPAKTIGARSARRMYIGVFPPPASVRHSKNPSAGTTQRRLTRARRNEGLSARVSPRALIIRAPMAGSFAQGGTSPQRHSPALRRPSDAATTTMSWVGQML